MPVSPAGARCYVQGSLALHQGRKVRRVALASRQTGTVSLPGQIVILNGAPRSGKSSIVRVIQETFDDPWMNLGVDVFSLTRHAPTRSTSLASASDQEESVQTWRT